MQRKLNSPIGKHHCQSEEQKPASEKVYISNPKWISNMRSFAEMAIVARQSDKKARKKLPNCGNTVIFIGYSDHHEKDVYKFLKIHTKKPKFSRDFILLIKTYSQHMGITQVEFTESEEEKFVDAEDEEIAVGEGLFGPSQPVTIDDQIEHHVDVSDKVPNPPLIPVPYPKGSRELRILSLYKVVTYMLLTSTVLSAAFNSIAGFDEGSDTPKNYKDV
jgi:hypothetical protein